MDKASISQIKNHLSSYIKRVRAGETVLILDRDRPVARLERITGDEDPEGRLAQLESQGLVRRAQRSVPLDRLKAPPAAAMQSVLEALLREREEDR